MKLMRYSRKGEKKIQARMGVLLGDGVRRNIPWEQIVAALSVPTCYAIANTTIRMRLGHAAALLVTCVSFAGTGLTLAPFAGTMTSPQAVESTVWWQAVAALAAAACSGRSPSQT